MNNVGQTLGSLSASPRSPTSTARIVTILTIGSAVAVLIWAGAVYFGTVPSGPKYPHLKVGGTSAVSVILQNRWKSTYRELKGIDIDYASTGSTAGVGGLLDGTFAIAFTHAPLSNDQWERAQQKGKEIVQIPILLCGVAVVYNVKELKTKEPLKLTGEALADIFLGRITNWDDDALRALNPDVNLPATPITVVHREDSSGTTQLFTEYLAAVSPAWRNQIGPAASEIKWHVGEAAARNVGLAKRVDHIEGAIGYVDRLFTSYEDMHLNHAAIQNKDRSGFIRAEPENMTAAAVGVLSGISEDFSFSLANQPGDEAYPISGVIYAVCCANEKAVDQKTVVDFLQWVTHEGQPFAAKMDYAPLPPELVERAARRLEALK